MTYTVVKNKNRYDIVEKATDLVVKSLDNEKEANGIKRGLNLGKGFAGFTPPFFTVNFDVPLEDEHYDD